MKKLTYLLPILLMACGGAPQDDVIVDGPVVENTSGLEERLPDTCMLSNYAGSEGQQFSAIFVPDGVITRVIRPGEIVAQLYVAERVNFYVDGNDTVTRIICG